MVTFEVGTAGKVRKTPFLSPNAAINGGRGRERLEKFVETIGVRDQDSEDGSYQDFFPVGNRTGADVVGLFLMNR